MPSEKMNFPRLLADIGGTNARFALETQPAYLECIEVLPCKEYEHIEDAVRAYLSRHPEYCVSHAAFAIANPILGDWVQMTNHHWAFSQSELCRSLGFETLLFLNDFTAQALAIAAQDSNELLQIGGTSIREYAPKAVIGPGTGLGVSGLVFSSEKWTALSGEGGHVSFAPFNDEEAAVWQYARQIYGHVSAERLLSGAGLMLIHDALAEQYGSPKEATHPAELTQKALAGDSPLCRKTLDMFCAMLGTAASNLALTLGALGGVYLCGGIIPRLGTYFEQSPFRQRFEDKGRFSSYLADIPVFVVQDNFPGLYGAAAALRAELSK